MSKMTKTVTFDEVEARLAGKPDGFYVLDAAGVIIGGPYPEESDADDVRFYADLADRPWVGQWEDGVLDFSYSPDTIVGTS